MRLILLGAPGAGKGTQADILCREFGVAHVASGDLFREAQRKGTELGLLAKSYMEKGQLVPDEVTIKLILERLTESDCKSKGYLLDGFPRTLEQAKALDDALAQEGENIDQVINVSVSPEEIISRLGGRWICRECQTPYHEVAFPPQVAGKCDKCGGELYQRPDDTPETVKKRLDVYTAQTAPLIDYYKGKGTFMEVDGEQGIEELGASLVAALRKLG